MTYTFPKTDFKPEKCISAWVAGYPDDFMHPLYYSAFVN